MTKEERRNVKESDGAVSHSITIHLNAALKKQDRSEEWPDRGSPACRDLAPSL